MQLNRHIEGFYIVLGNAMKGILYYLIVFFLIIFCIGFYAHQIWGIYLQSFKSVYEAPFSIFCIFSMGNFSTNYLIDFNSGIGNSEGAALSRWFWVIGTNFDYPDRDFAVLLFQQYVYSNFVRILQKIRGIRFWEP